MRQLRQETQATLYTTRELIKISSVFQGTIYEPYDFLTDCTHNLVVHINPDVFKSPVLSGARLEKEELNRLAAQAEASFREALSDSIAVSRLPVEGFLILALGFHLPQVLTIQQEDTLMDALLRSLERAVGRIQQAYGLILQLSVSALHINTGNVYDAYHEALSIALHFPFFQNSRQIICFRDLHERLTPESIEEKHRLEQQWQVLMNAGNYEAAGGCLLQLIEIRASSPVTAFSLTQELISRLEFYSYQLCDTTILPLGTQEHLLQEIQEIRSVKTLEELREQVLKIMHVFSLAAGNGSAPERDLTWARKISSYIANHYADTSLNGAQLARTFGLAPAYLSHIFHIGTGIKLLDYIHLTRIEHIKQLLRTTKLSLQEIAGRTGYPDRYSMSRVFVRYTGMTPSEYRRQ